MKKHRFIIGEPISVGQLVVRDKDLISQWRSVLRLSVGEKIILLNGRGLEAQASLVSYAKDEAILNVESVLDDRRGDQHVSVTLACAILKKENFELVCQKATEIGVKKIIPVLTTRTVKLGLNQDRLEKILKEATEQSGQVLIPELSEALTLDDVLQIKVDRKIIFDKSGEMILKVDKNTTDSLILVGPEGGFEVEEVRKAKAEGFEVLSLGFGVLRAETAAVVGSYLAVNNLL